MKFYIWCTGDASVGIPGSQCCLDWPALEPRGSIDNEEFVKMVKETLRSTFVDIFDDKQTYCMTEEEYRRYTALEE